MIVIINWDFSKGNFSGIKVEEQGNKLIKGNFNLTKKPIWHDDLNHSFLIYDIYETNEYLAGFDENFRVISLGPYLPSHIPRSNKQYPIFSKIIINSKHGSMKDHNPWFNDGAKEGFEILTHLFSRILLESNLISNFDCIIPVPCKSINIQHLWDGVEIGSNILNQASNIPFCHFFRRIDDEDSEFEVIGETSLTDKKILLFDDVITDGTTKSKLVRMLVKENISDCIILTIGKTDHTIYESYE